MLPDRFSIDRIDISRGPQALLSGIGNPGGCIYTTTKSARLGANTNQIEVQYGDWDLYRDTLDISRTLVADKLALRVNALWQQSESWRVEGYDDRTGLHLAGTLKPFSQTTVRAEFETGDVNQNRFRPWTALNHFSGWEAAGAPFSPTYGTRPPATTNDSAISLGTQFGNTILPGSPYGNRPFNPANFWVSASPRQGILSNPLNIDDPSVHPRSANLVGAGSAQEWDYTVAGVLIEQRVSDSFFLEAAVYRQTEERLSVPLRFVNHPEYLSID